MFKKTENKKEAKIGKKINVKEDNEGKRYVWKEEKKMWK